MTFQGYKHGHWLLEQDLQRNVTQQSQQVPVAQRVRTVGYRAEVSQPKRGFETHAVAVVAMCN